MCLKSLSSPILFKKNCKNICKQLNVSKINSFIEGDFEFIIDAVNIFEKFYENRESGNFISMKLRMFFKKFMVPKNQRVVGKNLWQN